MVRLSNLRQRRVWEISSPLCLFCVYMNPNNQTYTSNYGTSMPATQLQEGVNQMNNLQTPKQDLGQSYADNAAKLMTMKTPAARQDYISNSDIPAKQTNYDDLSKQLYDIDKAIAASGQYKITPQTPEQYAAHPEQSPLALTEDILKSDKFSNPNPAFALQTRTVNNNNILDLLSSLSDSIGKEFNSRKNTYTSSVNSQETALKYISDLLDKSDKAKTAKSQTNVEYQRDLTSLISSKLDAKKGADKFVAPWDYQEIRREAASQGMSPKDFDDFFKDYRNPQNPNYPIDTTTTSAKSASKTLDYMGEVGNYKTREDALKDFELYKAVMEAEGVDSNQIRKAIDSKFPPPAITTQQPSAEGDNFKNWLKLLNINI